MEKTRWFLSLFIILFVTWFSSESRMLFPFGKALQSIFLRPFGLPSNCTLSKCGAGMSIPPLWAYSGGFGDFPVLCLCCLLHVICTLGGVRTCRSADLHESSTSLLLILAFEKQETIRPNCSRRNGHTGQKTASTRWWPWGGYGLCVRIWKGQ